VSFLTNLSLWKKITLLTAMGLILGVGVFSWLSIRAVNAATDATLQDRLTTAGIVAAYVDQEMERALSEMKSTAESISGNDDSNPTALVARLADTYDKQSMNIDSAYVLTNTGQVIWSSTGDERAFNVDMTTYSTVNHTIKSHDATISGLVMAPVTSNPVILLSSLTADGSILVVAIDLSESSIAGFIHPIKIGRTGYVEIVDENGIVLARTEPGPTLSRFEKSDHSGRFAALIAAGKPTQGVCHTCHEPDQKIEKRDVLAFTPIANVQWGVVVRQSEAEALAPANQLRQSLLLFGIGLVFVALLFVFVTTRNVGNRIHALTIASQRIASGNLTSPITELGRDEVGRLAGTLDYMRDKLKTSLGELERKTKELSSLLSVSEILTSTFDLAPILDAVVDRAAEVVSGADAGVILLQDEHGTVHVQSSVGLGKDALSNFTFANDDSTQAAKEHDTIADATAALLQTGLLRDRTRGFISGEIHHQGRHAGRVIMISFRDAHAFSESDGRLLQAIADYAALAIERAKLAQEAGEMRALYEADRLRSEFISSVSHELRTPLTFIKGYCTSLLRADVSWSETEKREFLLIMDAKTDELRDLIDKLLQSAKLEAGALKLEKEPLLMPRIARKVIDELATRAPKHTFTIDFPPAFPVVEADVRCIEQVVRNLVENAIKYAPKGGVIAISGRVEENRIVVSVRDHGIGIAPEHQDKLFERFYRIQNANGQSVPGTGLGLFIVKGHIEAHGGEVWLESQPDQGSAFYFSLPLSKTLAETEV
jgi:signal transduction histidine kinase/HAMP domain-containing protein